MRRQLNPIGKSVSVSFRVRVVRACVRACVRSCAGAWERCCSTLGTGTATNPTPGVISPFAPFAAICMGFKAFYGNLLTVAWALTLFFVDVIRMGFKHLLII